MVNKLKKGFTLIELLVVIAIIGILAAIIIANLGGARNVAKDGAVKSQLANMRAQMELYSQSHTNSYGTSADCTAGAFIAASSDNGVADLLGGIVSSGGAATCGSNGTTWAVSATLPSDGTTWCVDSAGKSVAALTATADVTAPNNWSCQ